MHAGDVKRCAADKADSVYSLSRVLWLQSFRTNHFFLSCRHSVVPAHMATAMTRSTTRSDKRPMSSDDMTSYSMTIGTCYPVYRSRHHALYPALILNTYPLQPLSFLLRSDGLLDTAFLQQEIIGDSVGSILASALGYVVAAVMKRYGMHCSAHCLTALHARLHSAHHFAPF